MPDRNTRPDSSRYLSSSETSRSWGGRPFEDVRRRSNLDPVLRPARAGLAMSFTVSPRLLWTDHFTNGVGGRRPLYSSISLPARRLWSAITGTMVIGDDHC